MGTIEVRSAAGRARLVAIAPLVGLALLAGCGSDAGTATAPTTAESASVSSTSTAASPPDDDTDTTATPGAVSGAAALGAGRGGGDDGGTSAVGSDDGSGPSDTTPEDGILAETGADEVAAEVDWATSAVDFRGTDGLLVAYECPAGGALGSVWGTDVYTDDSSVCTAAVHAGVINEIDGGLVVIEISAGLAAYEGTTANGVTSGSYGAWSGSYSFVG